jgi:hypothetical protein
VLYTFASSVDDVDMGVTHIVRGADHVTNTATQIQIMKALGGTPPTFAHHSLLTGPQGEELSKRLGVLSLRDLRARGVEPMALLPDGAAGVVEAGRAGLDRWTIWPKGSMSAPSAPRRPNSTPKTCSR